jgi:hypothetical protein
LIQNQVARAYICDGYYTLSNKGYKIPQDVAQGPTTKPFKQFNRITMVVKDMV